MKGSHTQNLPTDGQMPHQKCTYTSSLYSCD